MLLENSQNSQEKNICDRVSFLIKLQAETCNFIKKRDSDSQKPEAVARRCSVKKGVLRNFAKFRGKTPLLECLFLIKLQAETCNFVKKRDSDSQKPEAVARRCSVKKMFLEISQNSQEKHLCKSLFLNKVAGLRLLLYFYYNFKYLFLSLKRFKTFKSRVFCL